MLLAQALRSHSVQSVGKSFNGMESKITEVGRTAVRIGKLIPQRHQKYLTRITFAGRGTAGIDPYSTTTSASGPRYCQLLEPILPRRHYED